MKVFMNHVAEVMVFVGRTITYILNIIFIFSLVSSASGAAFLIDDDLTSVGTLSLFHGGTYGYEFTVGANSVQVIALGLYDQGGDGLISSHLITIWDTATAKPVGSQSIPLFPFPDLEYTINSFRYIDLPKPITLGAGRKYIIGVYMPLYSSYPVDWSTRIQRDSFNSAFVFNREVYTESVGMPGSYFDIDPDIPYAGPNFISQFAVPVPEPSTYIGAVMMLVAFGLSQRRRYIWV